MSTVKTYTRTDNKGLYSRAHRDELRDYGTDRLGKVRRKINNITQDKPWDIAESKADSDKVLALLVLELNDLGSVTSDLADIALAMLHGKPRAETLIRMRERFTALSEILK